MNHTYFMQLALNLASKGLGKVAPNPMVGCLIVRNNEVLASGYHQEFGFAHAEVNAIEQLDNSISTKDCILYVTLEPCSHFGKTPPCADLIIQKGFKLVVVACQDPNPLVAGKGIKKIKDSGIEVIEGVLEKEAIELNKTFFCYFKKKRPFIILKWAQTADGFISKWPIPINPADNFISGAISNNLVHQLRSQTMAIMVGKNTVLNDNPRLTTRLNNGKNPIRILIDKSLEIPFDYHVYNSDDQVIIFNSTVEKQSLNHQFIKIDFKQSIIPQILETLFQLNIQSILVEGGAYLLNSIIDIGIWDELMVIQNPNIYFNTGIKAPLIELKSSFEKVGDDNLFHIFN